MPGLCAYSFVPPSILYHVMFMLSIEYMFSCSELCRVSLERGSLTRKVKCAIISYKNWAIAYWEVCR